MATAVSSEEELLCSVCLELFSEPVSTPCGHNFCKGCITQSWDNKDISLCPLCDKSYDTRPELQINTSIQEMVSEFKQQQKSQCVDDLTTFTEATCDYCTDPKQKAFKSCLVCVSSYCETHLQPHLTVSRLKSHQLMDPVDNLEDRMCQQHQKPLELFCRNEDTCLCTMCALLEHKNHEFVSLKEEYDRKRSLLQQSQTKSQDMVEQRKLKIKEVQHCLELSLKVAKSEMFAGKKAFTALKQFVQRSQDQFIKKLEEKERLVQKKAEDLVEQLKKEICELEQRNTKAEQQQPTADHLHFLQNFTALTPPTGLKKWSSVTMELDLCEGSVAQALSELEENLSEEFKQMPSKIKLYKIQLFAVDVNLDPDHPSLVLSEDQQQEHHGDVKNNLPITPQEFSKSFYFEVQVKEKTEWTLGVAQECISRKQKVTVSPENGFWTICLRGDEYETCSNTWISLSVKHPPETVGVFVNYDEGLVSFYDVDSADLIYSYAECCFKEKLLPYFTSCVSAGCKRETPLNNNAVKSSANTAKSRGTGQISAFGQAPVFGSSTSTSSSSGTSTALPSGFGSSAIPTFGQQVCFGTGFGQLSSGGSLPGSSSGNTAFSFGGGGFFRGLESKPIGDTIKNNPFGVRASAGAFGQPVQTGFGSFSTPTKPGGFGTATGFGTGTHTFAFGGGASSGTAPSLGDPVESSAGKVRGAGTAASVFGGLGSTSKTPSFGAKANQSTGFRFGGKPSGFGEQKKK